MRRILVLTNGRLDSTLLMKIMKREGYVFSRMNTNYSPGTDFKPIIFKEAIYNSGAIKSVITILVP